MFKFLFATDFQLRDICIVRKSRVDPGSSLLFSPFPLFHVFLMMIISNTGRKTRASADEREKTVNNTSRRGATAAYHDEFPRGFGLSYTLS